MNLRLRRCVAHIAPQHHFAAIACVCCAGINCCTRIHRDLGGLAYIAPALPITTDQHRATAGRACGRNGAGSAECDVIRLKNDLSAFV